MWVVIYRCIYFLCSYCKCEVVKWMCKRKHGVCVCVLVFFGDVHSLVQCDFVGRHCGILEFYTMRVHLHQDDTNGKPLFLLLSLLLLCLYKNDITAHLPWHKIKPAVGVVMCRWCMWLQIYCVNLVEWRYIDRIFVFVFFFCAAFCSMQSNHSIIIYKIEEFVSICCALCASTYRTVSEVHARAHHGHGFRFAYECIQCIHTDIPASIIYYIVCMSMMMCSAEDKMWTLTIGWRKFFGCALQ